jgi:ABC-type cobalt transport system, ATPase component
LIKINNLTFQYSDTAKPALRNISLEIQDGEFVLITGPSGGGKSSLCRCLNGLIPHFYGGELTGKVEVESLDVMEHPTMELATKVGMVFQDPENQLVSTDVDREIAFGLENLGFPRELMAKRVEEALDTVGIAGLRHRATTELSGGEKQRVAIASVIALYPNILVLDEPTSELDPKGAEEVLNVVERLNDELGITVILVEHRLDRVVQHVDRMVVLDDGMIMADGVPRSILSDSRVALSGVGMPPVIKFTQGLKQRGIRIDNTPLTVKEGRTALAKTLQHHTIARNSPYCHSEAQSAEAIPKDSRTRLLRFPFATLRASAHRNDQGIRNEIAQSLIDVKGLWHAYPNGFVALKNINVKVCEGEFIAVMGRNASGKTTLVKHFNGLLKPTKGSVRVDDIDTRETTYSRASQESRLCFPEP